MKYRLLPGNKELRDYHLKKSRRELEQMFAGKVETPFEQRLGGGTPGNHAYLRARGNNIDDYHTPVPVLGEGKSPRNNASIEEANLLRGIIKFEVSSPTTILIDLKTGQLVEDENLNMRNMIAMSLEPLDPQTGVTVRDPRILGVWDEKTDTYREIPGRNLTRQFYQRLRERYEASDEPSNNVWNYVRDGKSYLESETSGNPEKE